MPSMLSVLSKASKADIQLEPFPHLVIEEALPWDLFNQLDAEFPDETRIVQNPNPPSNKLYSYSASLVLEDPDITPLWKEYFLYHTSPAFFHEVTQLFEEPLRKLYPDLFTRYGDGLERCTFDIRQGKTSQAKPTPTADVSMECQFVVNSPVKEAPSIVRGPHIDHKRKLYATLLYFRRDDDHATGSDLTLYRYKSGQPIVYDQDYDLEPNRVEPFRTVPYRKNTLAFWLNSFHSLHGVSPRTMTPVHRRYVNMICEMNRLPDGGLFDDHEALRAKTAPPGKVPAHANY